MSSETTPPGNPPQSGVKRRSEQLVGVVIDGKYKILERIGVGGGGIVYRAEQMQIERFVALKVLHSELVADEQALSRFRDEAKLASRITHPNAVCIYDCGVFEGLPYLVMELVTGKTLRKVLEEEKLISPARALAIVGTICETLTEAHALGIVHRDLKPDNIMVCPRADGSEWVEVLDFGVASMWRSLEGDDSSQWSFVGTPQYVAPEQLERGDADARADIYSLGVMLYELISGTNPFRGGTAMECLYKHLHHVPGLLRKEHPHLHITPQLDALVEKCLEKDRECRFANTAELLAEIRTCEAAYGAGKNRRRHFLLSAGALLVLAGGVLLFAKLRDEPVENQVVNSEVAHSTERLNAVQLSPAQLIQGQPGQAKPSIEQASTAQSRTAQSSTEQSSTGSAALPTTLSGALSGVMASDSALTASSLSGVSVSSESSVSAQGLLTIESRGRVAAVLINGEQYGETPLRKLPLAPGEYELVLRCQGCEEYVERLEIEAGVLIKRVIDIALVTPPDRPAGLGAEVGTEAVQESSVAAGVITARSAIGSSSSGQFSVEVSTSNTASSVSSPAVADSFLSLAKRAEEKYRKALYLEAIPLFEQALAKKDNVRARISLGNCYLRLRRFTEAESNFKGALQLAPYHAPVHYNLACLYALRGQRDEAVRSLTRAVELDSLSRYSIREEPDLRSIVNDPRVQRMIR